MTAAPMKPRERIAYVALGIIIILSAIVLYWAGVQKGDERDAAEQKAGVATERAEDYKDYILGIDADCMGRNGPVLAEGLKKAGRCPLAKKITEQEPLAPLKGDAGERGPGIIASTIVGGDLILTYSDGLVANAGRVQGADGKAGKRGETGERGPGIIDADITEGGDLVLAFTDGTSANLGRVVGLKGDRGEPGVKGDPGETPDLSGYATEDWVRALINALGCTVNTVGEQGPPLVFDCAVTGKP